MLSDNKKFDIISVGDCVMDCIMYVDRMPKIGETMKGIRINELRVPIFNKTR
jgi:hypothetical protein